MCGRYSLALSNEEVYDALQERLPRIFRGQQRWEREQDYRPNYNVAPRQRAPVVHRDQESGQAIIETMQWGLVPHWTKHPPTGAMNTINARSESLLDASSGGMWHALKAHKRCIVPAQGYYEWQKRASSKVAHFTRLPLGPKHDNANPPLMFFAGLYDVVKYVSPVESKFQRREGDEREPYPTGNPIPLATFTILTTTPTKDIAWLHDRMPCVLETEDEIMRWLDLGEVKGWEEGKGGTGELLRGTPGLDSFPVNPEVGKIGTNSPTYIQPVSERSDGIKSFFQKQQLSPAKPKSGSRTKVESKIKEEAEQKPKREEGEKPIKTEIEGKEEEDLGDDSNAPNPLPVKEETKETEETKEDIKAAPGSTPKRKRQEVEAEDNEDEEAIATRQTRGGHQTKVIRHNSDDAKTDQPAITSFFQSPSRSSEQKPPAPSKAVKKAKRAKS